jgi:hypothetical protein
VDYFRQCCLQKCKKKNATNFRNRSYGVQLMNRTRLFLVMQITYVCTLLCYRVPAKRYTENWTHVVQHNECCSKILRCRTTVQNLLSSSVNRPEWLGVFFLGSSQTSQNLCGHHFLHPGVYTGRNIKNIVKRSKCMGFSVNHNTHDKYENYQTRPTNSSQIIRNRLINNTGVLMHVKNTCSKH